MVYAIGLQRNRDYNIWVCGKNSVPLLKTCMKLRNWRSVYAVSRFKKNINIIHSLKHPLSPFWPGYSSQYS